MPNYISLFPTIVISIIFIVGLINVINPRFMWEKFESWKAVKEPSNLYFNMRRIGGVFVMIVSAALLIVPHTISKIFE